MGGRQISRGCFESEENLFEARTILKVQRYFNNSFFLLPRPGFYFFPSQSQSIITSSAFLLRFYFLPPTNFFFRFSHFSSLCFRGVGAGYVISLDTILLVFEQVQERDHTALENYVGYLSLLFGQGVEIYPRSL